MSSSSNRRRLRSRLAGFFGPVWRMLRPPRRLRFTREGRYFVAIAVGIGLAAINTGNNLLYLLLGWMLSVIVASGMLSELTMRGLRVRRRPPPRIHADQPFLMEISVENVKASLASYSIEIEDLNQGTPLDKKCFFLKIPAGRTQRTSYRHRFSRRGLYKLSGFRIGTKFPFALFRKSRILEQSDEVLVFPSIYPVPPPAPRSRHAEGTMVSRIGRTGEFFGLREYRQGDDRRDIHWRSTARSGRTLVREYEEESQRRVSLLIDNALPPGDEADPETGERPPNENDIEALERAINLCASLASAYVKKNYSVKFLARGVSVPFAAGEPQFIRILRELALLPTVTDDVSFSSALDARVETVLVIPADVAVPLGRPIDVSHVMQAG